MGIEWGWSGNRMGWEPCITRKAKSKTTQTELALLANSQMYKWQAQVQRATSEYVSGSEPGINKGYSVRHKLRFSYVDTSYPDDFLSFLRETV